MVIDTDARDVPVLWSELQVPSLGAAVNALAAREGVTRLASIGRWPSSSQFEDRIGKWAIDKQIDGVVWTALKPGFPDSRGTTPTLADLTAHINGLSAEQRARAAEYVTRAPVQIDTPMRQELEEALGARSRP